MSRVVQRLQGSRITAQWFIYEWAVGECRSIVNVVVQHRQSASVISTIRHANFMSPYNLSPFLSGHYDFRAGDLSQEEGEERPPLYIDQHVLQVDSISESLVHALRHREVHGGPSRR